MSHARLLRLVLAVGAVVLFLAAALLLLVLSETVLDLWRDLGELGPAARATFVAVGSALCFVFGWLLFRLLLPPRQERNTVAEPPDQDQVMQRLEKARELGLDTREVETELAALRQRRAAGEIHVAFLGEISSGKSSLIRALLPDADIVTGAAGGTTRAIAEYRWTSSAGDRLVLVDMPGLNEAGGGLDPLAEEEALRAHVVVFVAEGDLTRSQYDALQGLRELGKPLILALNKADRFTGSDLEQIRGRIAARVGEDVPLVAVQAGGEETVVRVAPDGSETRAVRERPAAVGDLAHVLQRTLDSQAAVLDSLRDSSVFVLVARKLDAATAARRRDEAEGIVRSFSRKAVIGALAAVTPGADIVIQGILASQMIRELSRLYEVPVRKVDTDLLIELVQRHVGRTVTLVLAVAGNALKAFPGVGTIAGGLMHAVAYGMVFDTLGRAVAESLAVRGELRPLQAAARFKETLGENLETSARQFARLALEEVRTGTRG
jgi:signal recognition particle receptor subunit beta